MLLTDTDILNASLAAKLPLIGDGWNGDRLNSCGYDLALGPEFKIPILDSEFQIVDPFHPPVFRAETHEDSIIIPPGHFVLGASLEWLNMPPDVIGLCVGRSTYCRAGVLTHVSPLEPGWRGRVTIEISNTNPLPVRVWVGKGITQVVFFKADKKPHRDYSQKGGRYQDQVGVTQGRPESQESSP